MLAGSLSTQVSKHTVAGCFQKGMLRFIGRLGVLVGQALVLFGRTGMLS